MMTLAEPVRFSLKNLKLETWYERSVLKNGKPGKRWILECAWYTPINVCDMCGKRSGPRKVTWRAGCYGYAYPNAPGLMCMGCWNRARPVIKLREDIDFLKYATNKLKREARKQNGNEHR